MYILKWKVLFVYMTGHHALECILIIACSCTSVCQQIVPHHSAHNGKCFFIHGLHTDHHIKRAICKLSILSTVAHQQVQPRSTLVCITFQSGMSLYVKGSVYMEEQVKMYNYYVQVICTHHTCRNTSIVMFIQHSASYTLTARYTLLGAEGCRVCTGGGTG